MALINDFIDENSRPTKMLTDVVWQNLFSELQIKIIPYENGAKKKMHYKKSKAMTDDYGYYLPDSTTNYQLYCQFINAILSDLRKGEDCFVFFEYQIEQLLHFHKNDLRSSYEDGYWKIWLERSI